MNLPEWMAPDAGCDMRCARCGQEVYVVLGADGIALTTRADDTAGFDRCEGWHVHPDGTSDPWYATHTLFPAELDDAVRDDSECPVCEEQETSEGEPSLIEVGFGLEVTDEQEHFVGMFRVCDDEGTPLTNGTFRCTHHHPDRSEALLCAHTNATDVADRWEGVTYHGPSIDGINTSGLLRPRNKEER